MMKNKSIILIGFMGSGKTTVGKCLAEILKYNFIDTDNEVILKECMSIPSIFEEKGEAYFRSVESAVLGEVVRRDGQVISTGGGIVTQKTNHQTLKEGIVIYLNATPAHIYNNVKNDTQRPLLQNDDVYGTICTMLEKRETLYKNVADYIIDVDNKTPWEICVEIIDNIKL